MNLWRRNSFCVLEIRKEVKRMKQETDNYNGENPPDKSDLGWKNVGVSIHGALHTNTSTNNVVGSFEVVQPGIRMLCI